MNGKLLIGVAVAAALAAACSPTRASHGFISESEETPQVQVGVDTKSTVLTRLGTPSTTAAFDEDSWYYISSVDQRFGFGRPKTVEREVLVVRFDAADNVSAVDRFGLDRGQVVSYSDDVTPTRGRELGLLEQIFGNIGRTPPIRTGENEEGPRRDRR
ncbi:MAG: outer membrane protein assembly factor BamE [Hyphomonadaceae bacterium]|nr:outer membrane protein assembly factor BamE [Hyphomonadaceae bacterium]